MFDELQAQKNMKKFILKHMNVKSLMANDN